MTEGYIATIPNGDQLVREAALVTQWKAIVAARAHETSAAIAAEQRALEAQLGRELTGDEVRDTTRRGQVKTVPPHPSSRQARFARGE
jgi:hypothetical protein